MWVHGELNIVKIGCLLNCLRLLTINLTFIVNHRGHLKSNYNTFWVLGRFFTGSNLFSVLLSYEASRVHKLWTLERDSKLETRFSSPETLPCHFWVHVKSKLAIVCRFVIQPFLTKNEATLLAISVTSIRWCSFSCLDLIWFRKRGDSNDQLSLVFLFFLAAACPLKNNFEFCQGAPSQHLSLDH